MGTPNSMAALQALLKLKSPTNMTATGDPYVTKMQDSLASGEDSLAPSEDDLIQAQNTPGVGEVNSGPYSATLSRDSLRDKGLAAVKQALQMQSIKHQQDLESRVVPEQVKGQYDVQAAEAAARAAADRLRYSQGEQDQRQATAIGASDGRTQTAIDAALARQHDSQDYKTAHPTVTAAQQVPPTLTKMADTAEQAYGSMMSRAARAMHMGDGGQAQYENALTAILDRKGNLQHVQEVIPVLQKVPGATIDEKIKNSGIPGLQNLDPYDRKYLGLKLGGQ